MADRDKLSETYDRSRSFGGDANAQRCYDVNSSSNAKRSGMLGPNQILKFTGQNPGSVIAALLGVILVGSVGGGLWISSLQSSIDQRDAFIDARIDLENERSLKALAAFQAKNVALEEQNKVFRDSLETVAQTINQTSAALESVLPLETMETWRAPIGWSNVIVSA